MENNTFHSDEQCRTLFLEWLNDFLTVGRFAEHHGFTKDYADAVVTYGKYVHKNLTEGASQ